MPDLPTLTVSSAQAQRILATFGDAPTYRRWLAGQVRAAVLAHEAKTIDEAHVVSRTQKLDALSGTLPDPETVT